MISEEKQLIANFLNSNLALLTLLGFIALIVWAGLLIYSWKTKKSNVVLATITDFALPVAFISTLGATLISLYYSDYLGLLPCGLCWFQRIFIYSQVFLFGLAWYKKEDKYIWGYSTILSVVGLVVALYQHYLQLGYSELIPCPAIASTIDCAKPTFIEYGFITFPFMAVVLFGMLLLLRITVSLTKR